MSRKSHLYFRNPIEGQARFRQKARFSGQEENEQEEVSSLNIQSLSDSIQSYRRGKQYRTEHKNLNLDIEVDYIEIEFYDVFNSKDFTIQYRNDFGLYPICFFKSNTIGVFAIIDRNLFRSFFNELEQIIIHNAQNEFNNNIKFIKSFNYHDIGVLTLHLEEKSCYALELVENPELFQDFILPLEDQLIEYLNDNDLIYKRDIDFNRIELLNATLETVQEIANNFDNIQTINSHDAGFIRPSLVQTPVRSFGFEVEDPSSDIPIIGVIDSGISDIPPLESLVINNGNSYSLTGDSPREDNSNHGTGVAALIAFGDKLYPEARGMIEPDAKLLSMKVIDSSRGRLPDKDVIDLIKAANAEYGVKLFNLCVGYIDPKTENSQMEKYAYMLDTLSYELDILIFISAGNHNGYFVESSPEGIDRAIPYPNQIRLNSAFIKTPAESMNNITIGAAAGNFELFDSINALSLDTDSSAYYSPRHHVNWKTKKQRPNKHLFKPDLLHYGGDFNFLLEDDSNSALRVMSSVTGEYFMRTCGTSYSTPLIANLAARLVKLYPNLNDNMQTIKALIINSAVKKTFICNHITSSRICKEEQVLGYGIPNTEKLLYSSENSITLVLEDSIEPGNLQIYPIHFPEYLNELPNQKLLKVTATLCFKFKPILNNEIAYCPIHISFGLFKNLLCEEQEIVRVNGRDRTLDKGINGNKTEHTKVGVTAWSEDYYYKNKPLSNVQQISLSISKAKLINEDGTFKIAVSSMYNKLLTSLERQNYEMPHSFSLVINIEEKSKTGRLYDGLIAENNLEVISEIDAETEVGQLDLFGDI
ncbi:MAG: S8 family peptidase [Dysgonomonas sp.]|uniref:S8 family peptidase n=1 Tax=Dysgonomonas sp. TaxID=1891233 RepID=UPI0039E373B2